jgi:hypothetical protein
VNLPPYQGTSGSAGQATPTPASILPPYTAALPLIKT